MGEDDGFEILKAENFPPPIDLIKVTDRGKNSVLSLQPFGPQKYPDNIITMHGPYANSKDNPKIYLSPATTRESIAVLSYVEFNYRPLDIFDPRWLQAGRAVIMSEGVAVNPPLDKNGNAVAYPILRNQINLARKIKVHKGNIYLGENDFGFAEYGSFQSGDQDCDEFAEGGLARILEHTTERAEKLRVMASKFLNGVSIPQIDGSSQPVDGIVGFLAGSQLDICKFVVDYSKMPSEIGFAFGALAN